VTVKKTSHCFLIVFNVSESRNLAHVAFFKVSESRNLAHVAFYVLLCKSQQAILDSSYTFDLDLGRELFLFRDWKKS
jgi:hypothetical protein